MADPIKFIPKDRQGDPDFPGIPELARFYKPSSCGKTTDMPVPMDAIDPFENEDIPLSGPGKPLP